MSDYPAGIVITTLARSGVAEAPTEEPRLRLAVKDNIDVAGAVTSEGSRFTFEESEPVVQSAPVVQAVVDAGAIPVAKVNLHEFAYGVTSNNPWFGAVPNPALPGRIPGGSSGGSAAALAVGLADVALGTDTSGSIRMPAGCVGVVGLRPRAGLLDLRGVRPLCPSFDTVGPMAFSVERVAWAWRALEGTSADADSEAGAPLRIGVHDPDARLGSDLFAALACSGATVIPARWGTGSGERFGEAFIEATLAALWPAFRYEAAHTHAGRFPARAPEYGASVARKLTAAQRSTERSHRESMRTLARLRTELLGGWHDAEIDAVVLPTLGCPVPRTGDPEHEYEDALGRYTAVWSGVNLPALAIGDVQIVARTERAVLRLGHQVERAGLKPMPARD
ncbi:amidase [Leucobacter chromiireducens]|uniref:amidase n=1 Tax=Leucobacter chromiireducens TaxID=283877 RepID=UPI000F63E98E|nr:amidase [Leucobacter chromiireducens]